MIPLAWFIGIMIILDVNTQIWPVGRPGGDPLADIRQHHQQHAIRVLKYTILRESLTAPANFLASDLLHPAVSYLEPAAPIKVAPDLTLRLRVNEGNVKISLNSCVKRRSIEIQCQLGGAQHESWPSRYEN